jgi:hypothetical protein
MALWRSRAGTHAAAPPCKRPWFCRRTWVRAWAASLLSSLSLPLSRPQPTLQRSAGHSHPPCAPPCLASDEAPLRDGRYSWVASRRDGLSVHVKQRIVTGLQNTEGWGACALCCLSLVSLLTSDLVLFCLVSLHAPSAALCPAPEISDRRANQTRRRRSQSGSPTPLPALRAFCHSP